MTIDELLLLLLMAMVITPLFCLLEFLVEQLPYPTIVKLAKKIRIYLSTQIGL